MDWEPTAQEKFKLMISKMPLFQRRMAEKMASNRAEKLAKEKGLGKIDEETIIRAFFLEVPRPFKGLMTNLMDGVGFDYKKYGYE